MNIRRFLKKVNYHIFKFPVIALKYYDSRLSMFLYNKLLSFSGVVLNGIPRFISTDVRIDSFELIEIGDRVVISERVILLTHDYSCTTALIAINEKPKTDISINAKIKIGNNVFIGMGCIVLPNTIIGDNVIIGAGTVVRGTVPSGSVYMGNPGKVVGLIQDNATKFKTKVNSLNIKIVKD